MFSIITHPCHPRKDLKRSKETCWRHLKFPFSTFGENQWCSANLFSGADGTQLGIRTCLVSMLRGVVGGGQVLMQRLLWLCLSAPQKKNELGFRWWNFNYFLSIFTPNVWGFMTQCDHIIFFQMGWNHQLEKQKGKKAGKKQSGSWMTLWAIVWLAFPSTFDKRVGSVPLYSCCVTSCGGLPLKKLGIEEEILPGTPNNHL